MRIFWLVLGHARNGRPAVVRKPLDERGLVTAPNFSTAYCALRPALHVNS
jgi:hypothetical protein